MCERVLQDISKKYSACAEINALNFLDLVKFLRYCRLLRANFKNRRFARNRGQLQWLRRWCAPSSHSNLPPASFRKSLCIRKKTGL